jgi:hypothetical protein
LSLAGVNAREPIALRIEVEFTVCMQAKMEAVSEVADPQPTVAET